jgi:pSer/pThr/pTyr-binding forkhead associated (FHA) protein
LFFFSLGVIISEKVYSVKEVVMATRQDMPMLIVYEGDMAGQRWLIDQDKMVIGRGTDCDITIPKRQISRHHAQIERDDQGYLLRDLGSKNGTFVNGDRLSDKHRLHSGDRISASCVAITYLG